MIHAVRHLLINRVYIDYRSYGENKYIMAANRWKQQLEYLTALSRCFCALQPLRHTVPPK